MINELFNQFVGLQKYINNRCECQSELLEVISSAHRDWQQALKELNW